MKDSTVRLGLALALSLGLSSGDSLLAEQLTLPSTAKVVVEPMLKSQWFQSRPFNDYMPVDLPKMPTGAALAKEQNRGRTPCGCVACGAAQILRYFEWPVRTDGVMSFEHSWKNTRKSGSTITGKVTLQFDGHVPLEWNVDATGHCAYGASDGRSKFAEMSRYPFARLTMWCGVMAEMNYATGDSRALFYPITERMSEWYETPVGEEFGTDYDRAKAAIVACMKDGVPVPLSVPGHQAVAHGWAEDGDTDYVYFAYDMYGQDGWFNAREAGLNTAFIGFRPKKMVQLEPLRAIEESTVTIRWTLPKLWQNRVTGFICTATPATGGVITREVESAARDCEFSGLVGGVRYSFEVMPKIEGAVKSAAMVTTIATAARPALEWPTIEVWGTSTNKFGETWYHENAMGSGFVYVKCPKTVGTLEATSGNPTALPPEKIGVKSYGNGYFAVSFDGSNVAAMPCSSGTVSMERQRLIVTLKATDSNGTSAYRNLSLRFSSEAAVEVPPESIDVGGDDPGIPLRGTTLILASLNRLTDRSVTTK